MHPSLVAVFLTDSPVAMAMCAAAVAVFVVGAWAARRDLSQAPAADKIVALANVCFGVPLAVFGALHLAGPQFVAPIVPPYMPGRMFWVDLVGVALIAAGLSIAARVAVPWSGVLLGTMMFLFVAMIHFPGALRLRHDRFIWTIVFRELSFGGAAWILAGKALKDTRGGARVLVNVGRVLVVAALVVFGVEHFLHPLGLPGVPLRKEMPPWVPLRPIVDYLTGAALLAVAGSTLLRRTRTVATWAGAWLLLTILVIYGPVLIAALAQPGTPVKVEGINYFFDTLLFAGAILALAGASPPTHARQPARLSARETRSTAGA